MPWLRRSHRTQKWHWRSEVWLIWQTSVIKCSEAQWSIFYIHQINRTCVSTYYTSCCRSPSCAVVPWNSYHGSGLIQEIFLTEFIPPVLPSCMQDLMLHLALLLISVNVVFVSLDVYYLSNIIMQQQARMLENLICLIYNVEVLAMVYEQSVPSLPSRSLSK